ncbi:helix-turn-helix transcriptional regulator [Streptomyces rubiginosohelvolus]|jgi:transcriptional regulator with XRE-family HTH domain|uniref:helix-turn-helix domain-containing protein n=1 Tax=Streptomyces TaxID=1883 RepID=UPI001B359C68|nr:helix-turn-helix transcriptional regulator [Streptomyces sp. C3-3]MBQ1117002.1 helix-turn-helix transcriptional regulator [Streptomyces sp. C3-3]
MGRTEKKIETANTALQDLVEWLRACRKAAGLTYRELAVRAGLHATTLQRAASANTVPGLNVVLAYARGCDMLVEDAHLLWKRARREQARSGRPNGRPAPAPSLVSDRAELSSALRALYEEAGAPSLRDMEERAGAFGFLPRSSAHRIVNKQAVPRDRDQLHAFLRACEVSENRWKEWEGAWGRVLRAEKQESEVGLEAAAVLPGPQFYRPMVPHQRSDRAHPADLDTFLLSSRRLVESGAAAMTRIRSRGQDRIRVRALSGPLEPTLF